MDAELIDALVKRTASACISASTARKMGPKGTVAAARAYLKTLRLAEFQCKSVRDFQSVLDGSTHAFVNHLYRVEDHAAIQFALKMVSKCHVSQRVPNALKAGISRRGRPSSLAVQCAPQIIHYIAGGFARRAKME